MLPPGQKFASVEDYINVFPPDIKKALKEMRSIIKKLVPKAEEVISYNMPAFKENGILVWYAGYKQHIGFYPKPAVIDSFKKELAAYKTSKGAIQFPLDEPLPVPLITKIVKQRIAENKAEAAAKAKKKK